jgi:hypothetical protein
MDATPEVAAGPGQQADAGVPARQPAHAAHLWVGLLLALLLLAGFATAFCGARAIVADAEARARSNTQAADRLDATMRSVQVSGGR